MLTRRPRCVKLKRCKSAGCISISIFGQIEANYRHTVQPPVQNAQSRRSHETAAGPRFDPIGSTNGVLKVGDKELLSISIFEDRQGAAESTRKAAEFVQKDPMKDQLSKPEVLEGELLVLREAAVGVR